MTTTGTTQNSCLHEIGSGIYQDFSQNMREPSGQMLVVKATEIVLDTMKAVDPSLLSPGLTNLRSSCTLLRGSYSTFGIFKTAEDTFSTTRKFFQGLYEGAANNVTEGWNAAGGAVLALAGHVSGLYRNFLDIWIGLSKLQLAKAPAVSYLALSGGVGALMGGISKTLISSYCFLFPETDSKEFSTSSTKSTYRIPPMQFQNQIKSAYEVIDGISTTTLGALSLCVKHANPFLVLGLKITGLVSQISARYVPRIANALTRN